VAVVRFENVSKVYDDGTEAVRDLVLGVSDGELMVLVGPSGCGKTTALRMVAGLEKVSGGAVYIGDRVVNDVEPADRDIAMVFQNYALYPHMTVFDNIAFPLRLRHVKRAERRAKVLAMARMLGLAELLDRKPRSLSGGQRQRVAMGRALVREPAVFLMDEPLSNLDAKLRVQMRAEIVGLQREVGVTTVYVTHDQTEAMTIGNRVAVMRSSELQQVAAPEDVYSYPCNVFVASFIGSPPMNLVVGSVESLGGVPRVRVGPFSLRLDETECSRYAGALANHRDVIVGVRPEDLEVEASPDDRESDRQLDAVAKIRESLGSDALIYAELREVTALPAKLLNLADETSGSLLTLRDEGHAMVIGRTHARALVRPGDQVRLTVGAGALRLFDCTTGTHL
jgi:multiple sugar transport system ATP-binding protein